MRPWGHSGKHGAILLGRSAPHLGYFCISLDYLYFFDVHRHNIVIIIIIIFIIDVQLAVCVQGRS